VDAATYPAIRRPHPPSGDCSTVTLHHPALPIPALHRAGSLGLGWCRFNQLVVESLVIPLPVMGGLEMLSGD